MIQVCEMLYDKDEITPSEAELISFDERYIEAYMDSYNMAFRPMREALNIKPYDWYADTEAIRAKAKDIFLLTEGERLIGSVACYGNEVDDLFVADDYKQKGYGRQILLWAIDHIRSQGHKDIVLHVAMWNSNALGLYKDTGFRITKTEDV